MTKFAKIYVKRGFDAFVTIRIYSKIQRNIGYMRYKQ